MSQSEVRDELELRVLEAVRTPGAFEPFEQVGAEATFLLLSHELDQLRRGRAAYEAKVSNHPKLTGDVSFGRLEVEHDDNTRAIIALLDDPTLALTRRQRMWLAAFRRDVAACGKLNMSRVADELGRNRSCAAKAKLAIRRALAKRGADALLGP